MSVKHWAEFNEEENIQLWILIEWVIEINRKLHKICKIWVTKFDVVSSSVRFFFWIFDKSLWRFQSVSLFDFCINLIDSSADRERFLTSIAKKFFKL